MSEHATTTRPLQESDAFRLAISRYRARAGQSWLRITHRFAFEVVKAISAGIRVDLEATRLAYIAPEAIEQSRSVLSEEVQITFRLKNRPPEIDVEDVWAKLCRDHKVIVMRHREPPERRFVFTFTSRSSLAGNLLSLQRMLKDLSVQASRIAVAPGDEATFKSDVGGLGRESFYY